MSIGIEHADFISTMEEVHQQLLNPKAQVPGVRAKWFKKLSQVKLCRLHTQNQDVREAQPKAREVKLQELRASRTWPQLFYPFELLPFLCFSFSS